MPVYEYVCKPCELKFEKYVASWGETVRCPACEGGAVEKQLSTFAVSGSGGAPAAAAGGACCGRGGCGCAH